MSGWLLQRIEIEGMRRQINNEDEPLVIKFKDNCVTSISAPNGVGKSSIFDALSFAIRGKIPEDRPTDQRRNMARIITLIAFTVSTEDK